MGREFRTADQMHLLKPNQKVPCRLCSPRGSSSDYFTLLPKIFLLLLLTFRIESNFTRAHRALHHTAPDYSSYIVFTACFTRTQLLNFLPLPQVINLVPAPTFSHLGSLCLEQVPSNFHMPNYFAYIRFWNRYASSRIPFLSLYLKYCILHYSHIPLPTFIFFITLKSIWNVIIFNICLHASMLPSSSRKEAPWE